MSLYISMFTPTKCSMIDSVANQRDLLAVLFYKLLFDFSRSDSQQIRCLSVSRVSGCENCIARSVCRLAV